VNDECKFKKGDRVKHRFYGEGTVLRNAMSEYSIPVRFDVKNGLFHNCDGLCENGYGYWVVKENITLIKRADQKPKVGDKVVITDYRTAGGEKFESYNGRIGVLEPPQNTPAEFTFRDREGVLGVNSSEISLVEEKGLLRSKHKTKGGDNMGIEVGDFVKCKGGFDKQQAGQGYSPGLEFKVTNKITNIEDTICFGGDRGNGVYMKYLVQSKNNKKKKGWFKKMEIKNSIIETFEKTKNAKLVQSQFGDEADPFVEGLILETYKERILEEAKKRKEAAKADK
jgi:hypothetical protein